MQSTVTLHRMAACCFTHITAPGSANSPIWSCDSIQSFQYSAVDGVGLVTDLARIYALTGEKDLALKQLEIVSRIPCGPSYGELRLDSEWDSLRGDPRFEKLVEEAKQPFALK